MYQQNSFHRLSHSQLSDDLHARGGTEKRRKMEAHNNLLKNNAFFNGTLQTNLQI